MKKRTKKTTVEKAGRRVLHLKKMKRDFRSSFLDSLLIKKEELEKTLALLLSSQKEYEGELTAGNFTDEADMAQREISASSHYHLIDRKNRELRSIENLIARIRKDEQFGLCEECGEPIPQERLFVVPDATLCVRCQQEMEHAGHRFFGEDGESKDWNVTTEDWGGQEEDSKANEL